jgi:hypothetical protein
LVGGGRAWLASRWSPASVDLVGATPLLAKRPLEEFCLIRRLGPLRMKSPAGCWRSRPFVRSRPLRPNAVVIPGTSADRWLCPWPTQIVIPTTLAPETGEVSWVSVGLRRVLFLVEVNLSPSKSQDPSPGSEVIGFEVKSRGVSPTISGRAGSGTELASGCLMATSWRPAPRDLLSRGLDPCCDWPKTPQCNVPSFGLFLVAVIISFSEASCGVARRASVARPIETPRVWTVHLRALNRLDFYASSPLNPRSSGRVSLSPLCHHLLHRVVLSSLQLAFASAMLSAGALGGSEVGGLGGLSGHRRGRPVWSKNKAKDSAATPPVSRKRGRPQGS